MEEAYELVLKQEDVIGDVAEKVGDSPAYQQEDGAYQEQVLAQVEGMHAVSEQDPKTKAQIKELEQDLGVKGVVANAITGGMTTADFLPGTIGPTPQAEIPGQEVEAEKKEKMLRVVISGRFSVAYWRFWTLRHYLNNFILMISDR